MKLSAPAMALRRVSSRSTAAAAAAALSTRCPLSRRSASTLPARRTRALPPLRQQQPYSSSTSSGTAPNPATKPSNPSAPAAHTHYTLFPLTLPQGPPPAGAFTIDMPSLRREFLQLQSRAHPDRHAGAAKARAEAASSAINEAYRTLQDPLRRARYLLGLRGVDVEDDSAKLGGGTGGEGAAGGDMELLMEVMEAREAVEEAGTEEEVEGLKRENEERIKRSVGVLEEKFERGDVQGAAREAVRLGYWRNIEESLREWTAEGGGGVLHH